MRLAVFGDIHGNFMAAYDAVVHWVHHQSASIDQGLPAGDQGPPVVRARRGPDGRT